jgi:hypothetical protein
MPCRRQSSVVLPPASRLFQDPDDLLFREPFPTHRGALPAGILSPMLTVPVAQSSGSRSSSLAYLCGSTRATPAALSRAGGLTMARSMSAWKGCERSAAALLGGTRYPANTGGRLDCVGPKVVAQVKHVRTLSLASVEALAMEAAQEAVKLDPPRLGALIVKRSAGVGVKTPHLVVMTEETWKQLTAEVPPA